MDATPFCESETIAERTARHLAMCRELADLAMQLARAAASRALRDAEPTLATSPRPRAPDPTLAFARLSREIQHAIALEARLAAALPARVRAPEPVPEPEPVLGSEDEPAAATPAPVDRRRVLRRVFDDLTKAHPRRVSLRRAIAVQIDAHIAADPGHTIPAGDIRVSVARDLGLDIDGSAVSEATYDELVPHHFRGAARDPPRAAA